MWSYNKNPIYKYVFGEKYLVFKADISAAYIAVYYFLLNFIRLYRLKSFEPRSVPSRIGLRAEQL